jgi:hypothetical protein
MWPHICAWLSCNQQSLDLIVRSGMQYKVRALP